MIGMFIGRGEYPATGISFGIEPIFEALKERKREAPKTVTEALVIPIGTLKEAVKLANELRASGIRTEIDLLERGISSNLNYANSLGIPYVVFLGKKELAEKKVKLRDMRSGDEKLLAASDVKKAIVSHHTL
jgi:histidyl-tRNA synthetase